MQGTHITRRLRNITSVAAIAIALNGCFLEEEIEDPLANVEFDNEISGSVGDGPIVGAAMRVLANDGQLLEEFESDATAGFNVVIKTKGKFYPLTIDANDGIDLVTGLAPDFALSGVAIEPGKKSVANINPFSTLAMELAKDVPGGLSRSSLEMAEAIISARLGSGLSTLAESGPMTTEINANNVAEIVKSSETLGEIIRRTRDWLLIAGFSASGDSTIQALGSDLTDGVIDGAGGPRANAHAAAFANILSAQVLLEAAANELHVYNQLATTKLESAIRQIGFSSPSPSLGELTVTQQMLDQIAVGLAVAEVVSGNAAVADLRQAVEGIKPGSSPALVSSALPANFEQSLDGIMTTMVSADDQTIAEANEVARLASSDPAAGTEPDPTQNGVPTIQGAPATSVKAGSSYRFSPSASDPDGDLLSFNISAQPAWATFDGATGVLEGIPGESDAGVYADIQISVTDGVDTANLPAFSIAVTSASVNAPPTISGSPVAAVTQGQAYGFTPKASDPDGDDLSFSISGKPSWLSFSTFTGGLIGVPGPADVGTHSNIVISVSDGEASTSLAPFSITVNAMPVNSPPTISGAPPSAVTEGQAYSFAPSASDPDGDALTFSITGKPSWLSFSASTGALSGLPRASDVGTHSNIVISVSDGEASASLGPFAITVAATNSAPTISGSPASSVTVGESYDFRPNASDPDRDSLTFSISGKPQWLAFDPATGRISGVPAEKDVGIHGNLVISVSDGSKSASLGPFSITVQEADSNSPPVISGTPAATVTANSSYEFVPSASDPDGDAITFDIVGLPAWASFSTSDGRLFGTPGDGDIGVYEGIVITVSDGTDSASLGPFSITVDAVSLGSVTLMWTAPTENTDGSQLRDLAGYKIYWGTTSGDFSNSVKIDNPGLTTYVVENLSPGTYEFSATAYNSAGDESEFSNVATKVVK